MMIAGDGWQLAEGEDKETSEEDTDRHKDDQHWAQTLGPTSQEARCQG